MAENVDDSSAMALDDSMDGVEGSGVARSSPATLTGTASDKFRYKYKEADPPPAGVKREAWNKIFSAADSRIYNRNGRLATRSSAARASGQTRLEAEKMLEEKRQKEAVETTSLSSEQLFSANAFAEASSSVKMERSNSPDGTPVISGEPATSSSEKFKAKSRIAKKAKSASSSQQGSPAPSSTALGASMPASQVFKFGQSAPQANATPTAQTFSFEQQLPSQRHRLNFGEKITENEFMLQELKTLSAPDFFTSDAHRSENSLPAGLGPYSSTPPSTLSKNFNQMTIQSESKTKLESGSPTYDGLDVAQNIESEENSSQAQKKKRKRANRKRNKKASAAAALTKDIKGKGKSSSPDAEEEGSDGSESDDGGEYCICRGPDDHRKMIACDNCDEWYHCSCVDIKEGDIELIDKYICQKCFISGSRFTTWKPMCRLQGCRKPCRLNLENPSKYCSDEHRREFFAKIVSNMPDDTAPSRGGALNRGELKAALNHTKGDLKAFHALGAKPTLPAEPGARDWNKVLTEEEKARLCVIRDERTELKQRSDGYKDKEKFIRMCMDRLKKVTDANRELVGVCGWDARLAFNEEEFLNWRNSQSGITAFQTGVLGGSYCEKKRCPRHMVWVKLSIQDCRFEDVQIQKAIDKLRLEEYSIQERADLREATKTG